MGGKTNEQRGAVIVEACIALPVFMFFMITLLSIAKIAYVQARVSVSLDRTAKQIAAYSHIFYATGLGDKFKSGDGKSSEFFDQVSEYLDEINSFIGSDTLVSASDSLEATSITDIVKTEAIEAIALPMLKKNILGNDKATISDYEEFERKFHLVKGSMNMAGTKFLKDETEVYLQVHYKIEVIRLLSVEKTFQLGHCSYCEAWRGSDN